MAITEPKSAHLREVLLFAFNWKKSATEAHRMLEEVYSDHALSKSQCYRWFKKFQSGDFELDNEPRGKPPQKFEDAELQALLDEDSTQMQEKLTKQLQVSQGQQEGCVRSRLRSADRIRKVPSHFFRHDPRGRVLCLSVYSRIRGVLIKCLCVQDYKRDPRGPSHVSLPSDRINAVPSHMSLFAGLHEGFAEFLLKSHCVQVYKEDPRVASHVSLYTGGPAWSRLMCLCVQFYKEDPRVASHMYTQDLRGTVYRRILRDSSYASLSTGGSAEFHLVCLRVQVYRRIREFLLKFLCLQTRSEGSCLMFLCVQFYKEDPRVASHMYTQDLRGTVYRRIREFLLKFLCVQVYRQELRGTVSCVSVCRSSDTIRGVLSYVSLCAGLQTRSVGFRLKCLCVQVFRQNLRGPVQCVSVCRFAVRIRGVQTYVSLCLHEGSAEFLLKCLCVQVYRQNPLVTSEVPLRLNEGSSDFLLMCLCVQVNKEDPLVKSHVSLCVGLPTGFAGSRFMSLDMIRVVHISCVSERRSTGRIRVGASYLFLFLGLHEGSAEFLLKCLRVQVYRRIREFLLKFLCLQAGSAGHVLGVSVRRFTDRIRVVLSNLSLGAGLQKDPRVPSQVSLRAGLQENPRNFFSCISELRFTGRILGVPPHDFRHDPRGPDLCFSVCSYIGRSARSLLMCFRVHVYSRNRRVLLKCLCLQVYKGDQQGPSHVALCAGLFSDRIREAPSNVSLCADLHAGSVWSRLICLCLQEGCAGFRLMCLCVQVYKEDARGPVSCFSVCSSTRRIRRVASHVHRKDPRGPVSFVSVCRFSDRIREVYIKDPRSSFSNITVCKSIRRIRWSSLMCLWVQVYRRIREFLLKYHCVQVYKEDPLVESHVYRRIREFLLKSHCVQVYKEDPLFESHVSVRRSTHKEDPRGPFSLVSVCRFTDRIREVPSHVALFAGRIYVVPSHVSVCKSTGRMRGLRSHVALCAGLQEGCAGSRLMCLCRMSKTKRQAGQKEAELAPENKSVIDALTAMMRTLGWDAPTAAARFDGSSSAESFLRELERSPEFQSSSCDEQGRMVVAALEGEPQRILQSMDYLHEPYWRIKQVLEDLYLHPRLRPTKNSINYVAGLKACKNTIYRRNALLQSKSPTDCNTQQPVGMAHSGQENLWNRRRPESSRHFLSHRTPISSPIRETNKQSVKALIRGCVSYPEETRRISLHPAYTMQALPRAPLEQSVPTTIHLAWTACRSSSTSDTARGIFVTQETALPTGSAKPAQ
ncbi:hypothetical protein LAZ67_7002414 [Cordylochernes scorpioides]|uniref:Mos1 transposase HTH domain-containing protein n=1 Tax=Cordylochernes scorpioides TaxID=51811 RepID=A0ABY6KR32_9ARAC|nr:hypothetical protein LAZ67_7002414 [Cordylochernes scorpioides]